MYLTYEIWHHPAGNPQGSTTEPATRAEVLQAMESGRLPVRLADRVFSSAQVGVAGRDGRVRLVRGSAYLGTEGLWEVDALLRPLGWARPEGSHTPSFALERAEESVVRYVSSAHASPGACGLAPGV